MECKAANQRRDQCLPLARYTALCATVVPVVSDRCRQLFELRNEVVELRCEIVHAVDWVQTFYKGWDCCEDADFVVSEDFRVVQLTPPGSQCSIIIGEVITSTVPGSVQSLQLVVCDVEAARAELVHRGVDVSGLFDAKGVFHHAGPEFRAAGLDPKHRSYFSSASFSDPNGWLREVTTRAPGR